MLSKLLIVVPILVASMAVASYAASMTVTTVTAQAEAGLLYKITGNFTVDPVTFQQPVFFVSSDGTASPSPCIWISTLNAVALCNTALTAAHWEFVAVLRLTNTQTSPATYTIHVYTCFSVSGCDLGPLTFTVPTGAAAGTAMNFFFDMGSSTVSSPITFNIVVS